MNPNLKVVKTKPRVGFDVTEEQDAQLKRLIPWGLKSILFQTMTEDLIAVLSSNQDKIGVIISALITKQIRFSEIMQLTRKMQDDNNGLEAESVSASA